jgi:hypothetical protein|tara:strand:+ start:1162 stop:1302 length:141 start_codon:yes stop_codon:yes gene_type:complete
MKAARRRRVVENAASNQIESLARSLARAPRWRGTSGEVVACCIVII